MIEQSELFKMDSLNEQAISVIEPLIQNPDVYQVALSKLNGGATLIDCGIKAEGCDEAGLLFSKACMSGLAEIEIVSSSCGVPGLRAVSVSVDNAVEACMASQYAGWAIKNGG